MTNREGDDSERNKLWERYWGDLPAGQGTALWDSEASINAGLHVTWFGRHFSPEPPLLDVGCGNGTQTALLADHYAQVIGLDVSGSAVRAAAEAHQRPGLSFRRFDIADPEAGRALHAELGDCNVYIRTLLHLLPRPARVIAAGNIARLMGTTGGVFVTELSRSSIPVFESALSANSMPKVRRNLAYGIVGADLAEGELEDLLSEHGIAIVDRGSATMRSTDVTDGGERLLIPLDYVIGSACG